MFYILNVFMGQQQILDSSIGRSKMRQKIARTSRSPFKPSNTQNHPPKSSFASPSPYDQSAQAHLHQQKLTSHHHHSSTLSSASMKIRRNQQIFLISSSDPTIPSKLQALGKLSHLFNRKQSSIFYHLQLFSQMMKFFEENSTIREKEIFPVCGKCKEGIEDLESIWKIKVQRHIVEGFSRISYEQKQVMERGGVLEEVLERGRVGRVFERLRECVEVRRKKRERARREDEERERESQRLRDLSESRILRKTDESTRKHNASNFSHLFSQFQSIPQQDYNQKLNHLKSLSKIELQIQNIKTTLNQTYEMLKMRDEENRRREKGKENSMMLERTVDESNDLGKIKNKGKRRLSLTEDIVISDKTIGRGKLDGENTQRKRRRQFEQQRLKYLSQSGLPTKRVGKEETKENRNTKRQQKIQMKNKDKHTKRQNIRTRTITHHILQPVIHNIIQPIQHYVIPPLFSSQNISHQHHHHSFTFCNTERRSYPIYSETVPVREGSRREERQEKFGGRPMTERRKSTRASVTVSFY